MEYSPWLGQLCGNGLWLHVGTYGKVQYLACSPLNGPLHDLATIFKWALLHQTRYSAWFLKFGLCLRSPILRAFSVFLKKGQEFTSVSRSLLGFMYTPFMFKNCKSCLHICMKTSQNSDNLKIKRSEMLNFLDFSCCKH